MFGLVDIDLLFVLSKTDVTRGHSYKLGLYILQSWIDVCKYIFSHRIIRCWNTLPASDEDFSCLFSCKRRLYRSDLSRFILLSAWSTVSMFLFLFCLSQWYDTSRPSEQLAPHCTAELTRLPSGRPGTQGRHMTWLRLSYVATLRPWATWRQTS